MIAINDCQPEGLLLCPAQLTTKEFERLITVPSLNKLIISGVTSSYVRKLGKAADQIFRVSEVGDILVMERVRAPRLTTDLELLDAQIVFHAERVAALVQDRAKTLTIQPAYEDAMAQMVGEADNYQPVEVVPEAQPAEEFSLDKIMGDD